MRISMIAYLLLPLVMWPAAAAGQAIAGYIVQTPDEEHTMWCLYGTPPYVAEIWFWGLHTPEGFDAAEFDVIYPDNVVPDTLMLHDAVSDSVQGGLPGGIRVHLSECVGSEWVWLCRQRITVIDAEKSTVVLTGHPESGLIRLAICEEDHPFKTCWSCSLLVNYTELDPECQAFEPYGLPCSEPVAARGATWGSIKAIHK